MAVVNRVGSNVVKIGIESDIEVSLDEYIKSNQVIPISIFKRGSISEAIESAVTFLITKKCGSVEIPSSIEVDSPVKVRISVNKDNAIVENFTFTSHRYPIGIEGRPYTGENWKVGDIVFNNDIIGTPCVGWICIEEGTPGKWKQFANIKSWHTQLEELPALPDASELQLGRQVLVHVDEILADCLYYCARDADGVYKWFIQNEENINTAILEALNVRVSDVEGSILAFDERFTNIDEDISSIGGRVSALEISGTENFTSTISTTWVGSASPYSQVITVTGILPIDNPYVSLVLSGNQVTDGLMKEDWANVYSIVTSLNTITVYSYSITSVALPIVIQSNR